MKPSFCTLELTIVLIPDFFILRIAQKREDGVRQEFMKKLGEDKKMPKQEKDERL